MKNYRFAIIALLAAASLAVACGEDILRDVEECYITLDTENTYTVGQEVKFNIKGNPDYIYFFPGDTSHQYEYRDRTTVAMEDLETCKLVISYYADYGLAGSLDVYASKTFEGLNGYDAESDLATMRAIEASMDENKQIPGWNKLQYDEGARKQWTTQEYDITEYADSFCLAFHWNPPVFDQQQRTYWINFSLKTKFKGYDETTTKGTAMGMTSVSMNVGDDPKITDAYHKNSGNGTVIFTDADKDIKMQGVGAGALKYAINSWVLTKPRQLNDIEPDTGYSVKAVADDIYEYSYVYDKPGTYEATFMITNGNYQGTERKIQKMTINIIEPIEDGIPEEPAE